MRLVANPKTWLLEVLADVPEGDDVILGISEGDTAWTASWAAEPIEDDPEFKVVTLETQAPGYPLQFTFVSEYPNAGGSSIPEGAPLAGWGGLRVEGKTALVHLDMGGHPLNCEIQLNDNLGVQ